MIFLVPAILAFFGLSTGRDGLVWLAVGLFVWLSWSRKKGQRWRSRLLSVPMPDDVKVPAVGGRAPSITTDGPDGPTCGCA